MVVRLLREEVVGDAVMIRSTLMAYIYSILKATTTLVNPTSRLAKTRRQMEASSIQPPRNPPSHQLSQNAV